MGRRKRRAGEMDRDAILLVDKPIGPTSHDVVQSVRRAANQSRVGHTGTLDPAATGVLVVCLGRATKLVRFLQAGTKTYAARMVLGVTTDSQDADGRITDRRDAGHVDERAFCEAMTAFQGSITQIPPMVSAVKVDGQRLHELARRGEEVDREARPVTIHDLVLDAFEVGEEPKHPQAAFLVTCSAGTYVRTLAHDLGAALGVGGSLTALRRVANGPFTVEESHTLETIAQAGTAHVQTGTTDAFDAFVMDPLAAVSRCLPVIEVAALGPVRRLVQGGRLAAEYLAPVRASGYTGPVAVRLGELLIGIYAGAADEARAELVWSQPADLPTEDR